MTSSKATIPTTIPWLKELIKDERHFYRGEKRQLGDYEKKQMAVVGGSKDTEFLLALLYELYSGTLYGDRTMVDVFLVDRPTNLKKVEFLYSSFWVSGLPFFHGLYLTSDPTEALAKAEYVIIHPFIKWRNGFSRERVINEQFNFFRKLANYLVDYCRLDVQVLLIGSRCMIPFRLILSIYLTKLPLSRVHGVSRTVERAAAALLAHKLERNSSDIRGVAVFGEDILELENAWIQEDPKKEADLLDPSWVKRGDLELSFWLEKPEDLQKKTKELLRRAEMSGQQPSASEDFEDLPSLMGSTEGDPRGRWNQGYIYDEGPFIRSPVDEQEGAAVEDAASQDVPLQRKEKEPSSINEEYVDKSISEENSQSHEQERKKAVDWRQWKKERFGSEDEPVRRVPGVPARQMAATSFQEFSKPWQCRIHQEPFSPPEDDSGTFHSTGPVQDSSWIVNSLDEKFLKSTIYKSCRNHLSGFSYAKGVLNYIRKVLLTQEIVFTNEVVCSPGIYGIPEGLYSSFPVQIDSNGHCKIIQGYRLSDVTALRIKRMVTEVLADYKQVFSLFFSHPPREVKQLWQLKILEEEEQLPEEEFEDIPDVYPEEIEGETPKEELDEDVEQDELDRGY